MASAFSTFIDESGCEGFHFGKGSSEWFVLSGVVVRKAEEVESVKVVDLVRQKLGRPAKKPLHWKDLKHDHKVFFIDQCSRKPFKTVTVCIHKPSLKEPEKFQDKYRLYFYAVRYLLERISWLCRDTLPKSQLNERFTDLCFSNRSGMSYQQLKEYLSLLKEKTGLGDVRIDWSTVDENRAAALSPGRKMGLQIADAVAGAVFNALERNRFGYTEPRYAIMLKPIVYHHSGRYLGYGLKFWPRETEELIRKSPELEWVRSNYE